MSQHADADRELRGLERGELLVSAHRRVGKGAAVAVHAPAGGGQPGASPDHGAGGGIRKRPYAGIPVAEEVERCRCADQFGRTRPVAGTGGALGVVDAGPGRYEQPGSLEGGHAQRGEIFGHGPPDRFPESRQAGGSDRGGRQSAGKLAGHGKSDVHDGQRPVVRRGNDERDHQPGPKAQAVLLRASWRGQQLSVHERNSWIYGAAV